MIKKIQLRGISRTPSDRMTEDGGMAESLNAHIEDSESAPTLPPVDVTEAEGLPTDKDYDILYIHKTSTYKNYICSRKIYKNEGYILPDGFAGYNVFWNIDDFFVWKTTRNGKIYLDLSYSGAEELGYIDSLRHADIVVSKRHIFDTSVGNDKAIYLFVSNIIFDEQSDYITIESNNAEFKTLEPDPNPVFYPEIGTWEKSESGAFVFNTITKLKTNVKKITHQGNLLGISSEDDFNWYLFSEKRYQLLGNNFAMPFVEISANNYKTSQYNLYEKIKDGQHTQNDKIETDAPISSFSYDHYAKTKTDKDYLATQWYHTYHPTSLNEAYNNKQNISDEDKHIYFPQDRDQKFYHIIENNYKALAVLYHDLNVLLAHNREKGYFTQPIFALLSFKLLDSSITTMPILIGNYSKTPYEIHYGFEDNFTSAIAPTVVASKCVREEHTIYTIELSQCYRIKIKIFSNIDELRKWKDLVQKISLYISPGIYGAYPKYKDVEIKNITSQVDGAPPPAVNDVTYNYTTVLSGDLQFRYDDTEQKLLRASTFYEIESWDFNEENLEKLINGLEIDPGDKQWMSEDILLTLPKITALNAKNYELVPEGFISFNRRMICYDFLEKISMNTCITSQAFVGNTSFNKYELNYIMIDDAGNEIVIANRFAYNNTYYNDTIGKDFYAFLLCPDTRVKYIDIYFYLDGKLTKSGRFELKEHPYLDCSYYYGGLNTRLYSLCNSRSENRSAVTQYLLPKRDAVYVSEIDNPFVFPLKSRYYFTDNIVGASIATTPLSTGQFGQFPLYVFTKGGIWSMETNSLGEFVTQKPVNRYVATSEKMILSLENTIIFLCSEGLMLMSGSELRNLSQNMNGRHWFITEHTGGNVIQDKEEWARYLPTLEDQTSFMAFMNNAEGIAYDFTGKRLIIFDSELPYQYVFNITSNTWHKTSIAELSGHSVQRTLNSYPDCLFVSSDEQGHPHLWNWSTLLDGNLESPVVTGILATRPFDLGESDILKTIKHIKIRGQYERYELNEDGAPDVQKPRVSYILLGSNDGINFTRLTSLRGKPWKMYRMIILFKLRPYERVSWIDIDYETRHTNKLR